MTDWVFVGRLLPLAVALSGGAAFAATTAGADVSLNGGYASNPYLATGGNTASGTVTARVEPVVTITSPTTTTTLSGGVAETAYSHRYHDTTDYWGAFSFQDRLSPLSTLGLKGGYSRRTSNSLEPILSPLPSDQGGQIIDPTIAQNIGRKVEVLNGSADFQSQISPRTLLQLQVFGADVRYPDRVTTNYDYTNYGSVLQLSQALDERITLGASFSASKSDYSEAIFGKATQFSPSLTTKIKLTPRLLLSASAGATFSKVDATGLSFTRTHFSGSASLCNTGARSHLCANARYAVSPTAFSGLSNVTSLGADYSYLLSPLSQITAQFNYSYTKSLGAGITHDYGYSSGEAGYSHKLTERLSIEAKAGYTSPFKSTVARKANIRGSVGIKFRLGREK